MMYIIANLKSDNPSINALDRFMFTDDDCLFIMNTASCIHLNQRIKNHKNKIYLNRWFNPLYWGDTNNIVPNTYHNLNIDKVIYVNGPNDRLSVNYNYPSSLGYIIDEPNKNFSSGFYSYLFTKYLFGFDDSNITLVNFLGAEQYWTDNFSFKHNLNYEYPYYKQCRFLNLVKELPNE